MLTRPTTSSELKEILAEVLFSKTNKVTKIADQSVISGLLYGNAKVAQKAIKDIALVESHLLPDSAFGEWLDKYAANHGISPRFGASSASTYVRLDAAPGTQYVAGLHVISGNDGINFDIETNLTIEEHGFAYTKVRAQVLGKKTNVDPYTLNKINPKPTGHSQVINEYVAEGGRDAESDDLFRKRIKETPNIHAQKTLSFLEQAFLKVNENILSVNFQGFDSDGKTILAIATQNGISLTQSELDSLLEAVEGSLAITDLRDFGNQKVGIKLINISYQEIDIDYYVDLDANYNPDDIRKATQVAFQKKVDFRNWIEGDKVRWDELLTIAKSIRGVKYIPNKTFYPNNDILIDKDKLPRFRSFVMRDLSGQVIASVKGTFSPLYYPASPIDSYIKSVLNDI